VARTRLAEFTPNPRQLAGGLGFVRYCYFCSLYIFFMLEAKYWKLNIVYSILDIKISNFEYQITNIQRTFSPNMVVHPPRGGLWG
jgi:hypothetical protein